MTAEQASTEISEEDAAGASFHGVTDWHAINWKSVNNNVRRLQARIEKRNKGKEMGQGESLAASPD